MAKLLLTTSIICIFSALALNFIPEELRGMVMQIMVAGLGIASLGLIFFERKNNRKKLVVAFMLLGIYAVFIESLSINTGFPYSQFVYKNEIGYKLFRLVPWTVFIIWPVLVISSYTFASIITTSKLSRIIVGVLILVVFDLVFDPVVLLLNFWEWKNIGIYYGVPAINFLGWVFSSLLSMVLLSKLISEYKSSFWAILLFGNFVIWSTMAGLNGLLIPVLIGISSCLFIFHMLKNEKI